MPSRRRPSKASLVERRRTGTVQVRKTVYFLQPTIERLERYAFNHRMSLWEVVEAAANEFLDRVTPVHTRRRTPTNSPPQSVPLAPPSTPAPRSKRRTQNVPTLNPPPPAAPPSMPTPPRSRRRSSTVPSPVNDSQAPPPSVPPSTRKTSAPPKSRRT